jgi:hypothetical protein
MSEHDPEHNNIALAPEEESSKRRFKGIGTKVRKAAKVVLPIAGVAVAVGGYKVADWNHKINNFENNEQLMFKYQGSKGLKCLNRTVMLHAGVVYRNTPNSVKKDPLGPLTHNSVAGQIEKGEEALVKRPVVYVDDEHTTWLGFMRDKTVGKKAENPDSNISAISDSMVWVNYSRLSNTFDANRQPLVSEMELTHSQGSSNTMDCHIANNRVVTGNNLSAAYLVGTFQAGAIQEINQGMDARY